MYGIPVAWISGYFFRGGFFSQQPESGETMMERRLRKRKVTNGSIEGGIVLVEPAEVHDLSLSGIRFKSVKKLDPNTRQKIAMLHNGRVLQLSGTVVRSSIANFREIEGLSVPIFEVAMHFDPASTGKKEDTLKALFHHL